MRLIDADALIDALNTLFKKQVTQFGYEGYEKADEKTQLVCDGIMDSIGCVLDMPTVDPQQAIRDAYKHGKSKGIKRGMAMAKRKHEEQST